MRRMIRVPCPLDPVGAADVAEAPWFFVMVDHLRCRNEVCPCSLNIVRGWGDLEDCSDSWAAAGRAGGDGRAGTAHPATYPGSSRKIASKRSAQRRNTSSKSGSN